MRATNLVQDLLKAWSGQERHEDLSAQAEELSCLAQPELLGKALDLTLAACSDGSGANASERAVCLRIISAALQEWRGKDCKESMEESSLLRVLRKGGNDSSWKVRLAAAELAGTWLSGKDVQSSSLLCSREGYWMLGWAQDPYEQVAQTALDAFKPSLMRVDVASSALALACRGFMDSDISELSLYCRCIQTLVLFMAAPAAFDQVLLAVRARLEADFSESTLRELMRVLQTLSQCKEGASWGVKQGELALSEMVKGLQLPAEELGTIKLATLRSWITCIENLIGGVSKQVCEGLLDGCAVALALAPIAWLGLGGDLTAPDEAQQADQRARRKLLSSCVHSVISLCTTALQAAEGPAPPARHRLLFSLMQYAAEGSPPAGQPPTVQCPWVSTNPAVAPLAREAIAALTGYPAPYVNSHLLAVASELRAWLKAPAVQSKQLLPLSSEVAHAAASPAGEAPDETKEPAMYAVAQVIRLVAFPALTGEALGELLPLVLPMLDSWRVTHQAMGLSLLLHLLECSTPTELSWHKALILDALERELQCASDAATVELSLACLVKVLSAASKAELEQTQASGLGVLSLIIRQTGRLGGGEASHPLRLIYVRGLGSLMGVDAVREGYALVPLLRPLLLLLLPLAQLSEPPGRGGSSSKLVVLASLEALQCLLVSCWPRVWRHVDAVLPCLLQVCQREQGDQEVKAKAMALIALAVKIAPKQGAELLGEIGNAVAVLQPLMDGILLL
ncbi:unnamed protein product [Chrysoparadoxa australica]